MILKRAAVALAVVCIAAVAGAQSRIEITGSVPAPVVVSVDSVRQQFHYPGCPRVSRAMERVGLAVARLRGLAQDPACAALAPKPVPLKPAQADDGAIRVLFIGNSLTYFNELPWMLEQLAAARGIRLRAAFEGRSGSDLKQQWERGRAVAKIREGRWDWVILQDQSTAPVMRPGVLPDYSRRFDREIRQARAKPVLFLTWARKDRPHDQALITSAYRNAAAATGAVIAPVGVVWERLRTKMQLFDGSDMHPNVTGTYLAACVFFTTITGQSPEGLPHRFDVEFQIPQFYRVSLENDVIDPVHAQAVQRAVWQEMRLPVRGSEPR